MNTTMGRFVLLSITLHAVMLAAVGHSPLPPVQSLLPTLTVALSETPKIPVRADHPPTKHVSLARRTTAAIVKNIPPSQAIATAAKTPYRSASDIIPASKQHADKNLEHTSSITTDPPSTLIAPKAPATGGGIHAATPPHGGEGPTQHLDTAQLTSQLDDQVRNALAPYFAYPLLARRHGWQGKVEVGLRVEANGHLSHMRIARSSGYRLLDDAALAALHHIDTVPRAAGWLDGHHFDMVLAIDYRLLDDQS